MIYEELHDAGQIIENILNQPLKLSDLPEDVSLLSAAILFTDEDPATSTLKKVLDELDGHPEAREVLLRELDILAEELKS